MSAQTDPSSLDKYGDDDFLSTVLRYGLFLGALFQILCIVGSSILLPSSDYGSEDGNEDLKHNGDSAHNSTLPNVRRLHKLRKQEKKKRR